jgi:hypothetical protein
VSAVYFDSSAFAKLLIAEDGSDLALSVWNECDVAVSSRLAYPEVRAALAAAWRAGRLTRTQLHAAEERWAEYWPAIWQLELTAAIAVIGGDLAREYALSGADAVHLASVFSIFGESPVLAAWDRRLRSGAGAAGVRLVPASID